MSYINICMHTTGKSKGWDVIHLPDVAILCRDPGQIDVLAAEEEQGGDGEGGDHGQPHHQLGHAGQVELQAAHHHATHDDAQECRRDDHSTWNMEDATVSNVRSL